MKPRTLIIIAATALLYTLPGLVPGRLLVPADLPRDLLAWKRDPAVRVRVSNSLLSDVPLQFIPWDTEASRLLRSGHWPWRNRFAGNGAPLFANPQAALLSPFTWPRLAGGLRGWGWTVFLKLLAAGLSMFWLARVLGLSETEAELSAIVFALCGTTITLLLYPFTNVFVFLPALCAAGVLLARQVTTPRVILTVVVAALATAGGHPETLFIGVVSIVVFKLVNRDAVPRATPFLTAALAGFLLLAVQVVPFAILAWRSHARFARVTELPAHFRKYSLPALILPGYLGSPLRGELDLTGVMPNAENFVLRNGGYIGALMLLAIGLSLRAMPRAIQRGVVIGLGGLVLSWWIPGIRDLLRLIPLVRLISFDYFALSFAFFAALASGAALMAVTRGPRHPMIAAVLLACGAALLLGGLLPSLAPDHLQRAVRSVVQRLQQSGYLNQTAEVYQQRLAYYLSSAKWTAFRRIALPGLCWLFFGAGLLLRPARLRSGLLISAAVAELIFFGFGYVPSIHTNEVAPEPAFVLPIDRRWSIAGAGEVFPANLGTLFQLRDISSYDVLTSEEETQRLMRAGYDPFLHRFPLHPSQAQLDALAEMGVRYWIGDSGVVELTSVRPPPPAITDPPDGMALGGAGSLAGLLLLLALIIPTRWYWAVSMRHRRPRD
jgi:hypothetical protein